MSGRFVLACLGAMSTLGCADMLGLGGLTFDQTASGGASAGGTAGSGGLASGVGGAGAGGSGGVLGTGGFLVGSGGVATGGTPAVLSDEYPLTWEAGAIVAAPWPGFGPTAQSGNGLYWVYQPDTGILTTYQLDLLLPDELGVSDTEVGWDVLYAPRFDGDEWVFGYDQPTGLVDFGPAPAPGESFDTDTRAGSPNWTHVLLAGDADAPYLIAADSSTGMVRIGPADARVVDPMISGVTWGAPFTELVAYRQGEVDGLLRLDSASGQVDFVPIEDGSLGTPTLLDLHPDAGWSLAATYPGKTGPGLVLYWASDGGVETYVAQANNTFSHDDTLWRLDVTAIVPVIENGEPWAITYDGETGIADLRSLEPLQGSVVVK